MADVMEVEGRMWSVAYAHHYREVAKHDGKEHDYRTNDDIYVFAPTLDDALRLFRIKYPDVRAYVVHAINNRGGSTAVLAAPIEASS